MESIRKPLIIGHRGAAGLAPENTLAAFARAIDLGVDGVELDVQLSADGEVVVHHDFCLKPEIARDSDGQWIRQDEGRWIKNLTLSQLRSYDVGRLKPGTEYEKRYPEQEPAEGSTIPLLKEVIALLKEKAPPELTLWIEIKTSPVKPELSPPPESVAEKVVSVVRSERFVQRSRILSFDWRALAITQERIPEIPVIFLTEFNQFQDPKHPAIQLWTAGVVPSDHDNSPPRIIRAAGGLYWAGEYRDLTAARVREAHEQGVSVYAWTADIEQDMVGLINNGVDGIITNRPDRLISVMANR
jgi:glycerophosphoryl diester phosphodiesterase